MITEKRAKNELQLTNGIEFLASGVEKMKEHSRLLRAQRNAGGSNLIIPLTATLCVGLANMSQGCELIIKTALAENQVKDSGLNQHELFKRFELFATEAGGFEELKSQQADHSWVEHALTKLEQQFLNARYFGQRGKEKVDTVRPDVVVRIALWIVFKVYPHQLQYACNRLNIPISSATTE